MPSRNPSGRVRNKAGVAQSGFSQTDVNTDPFENVPLDSDALFNFFTTRQAMRQNMSYDGVLPRNDQLASWRALALPGSVGSKSRSLVTLDATRKRGAVSAGANVAQEGQYKGSTSVLDAGTLAARGGGIMALTQPARLRFPTGSGFEHGCVLGLFLIDQADTTAIVRVFNRAADANNRVEAAYANTGTPTAVTNRVVASATTAEHTAINLTAMANGTSEYVALGLRTTATGYGLFVNGRRLASGTLNAAAQALAGNGVGFALEGANLRSQLIAFDAFTLTS
jgi:hypothetical protein